MPNSFDSTDTIVTNIPFGTGSYEKLLKDKAIFFMYRENEHPDQKPKGYEGLYAEHFHASYEMLLFLEGKADFVIGGQTFSLKPYDLIIIEPGKHHNINVDPGFKYTRAVFHFDLEELGEPCFKESLKKIVPVMNIQGTPLQSEFRKVKALVNSTAKEYQGIVLRGQLLVILSLLSSISTAPRQADYRNQDLEEVLDYIEQNLETIQSADDIYNHFPKSQSFLQKLFTSSLNTSIMSYVRTRKCFLAKKLLAEGIPAKVVYKQCGFTTYSTFYRDYCKTHGEAPTSKRKA